MLPEFPDFSPVELDFGDQIEQLTAGFDPYADFNFVELWCWNQGDGGGVTTLNGNLVIRWEDVVTGELFLTFLGDSHPVETAETLIEHARATGIDPHLLAVPEVVVERGNLQRSLEVGDDRANWDYLLSTAEWSTMAGSHYKNKRNAIHRLERNFDPEIRRLDLANPAVQSDVLRLCQLWAELRRRPVETTRAEFMAIENLLTYARERPRNRLFTIGVYEGGEMIGFSVNEELPDRYAIGHFAKADYRYEGIYPFMLRRVCQHMASQGIVNLNIEADLGDPGLHTAKRLCHPTGMLRKYSISKGAR